ncbi:MAG: putative Ig domain-containing protein, partial [Planctomycetota bacterium]
NMPPLILEDTPFSFDGKVYSFRVRATDPDGDRLSYSLGNAPEGMGIDAETGEVTWNVPQDFTGEVPVIVAVSDGTEKPTTREITLVIEQSEEESGESGK